ncbi:MAG: flagellar basal body-associated FliL family protein [Bacteroidota bacterium]
MAKEAKPVEEGTEVPKKKSKKLLIIILAAVLVLVLAGGGAAYMLIKKGDHADDDENAEETTKSAKKKKDGHEVPPVFVNLEPFTVNLIPESGDQYLQVVLSVELEDPLGEAAIKGQMPKIRNNITLLLSAKKASELLPKEGKERLAESLKDEINSAIEPPKKNKKGEAAGAEGPVKSVLFTSFIIQ